MVLNSHEREMQKNSQITNPLYIKKNSNALAYIETQLYLVVRRSFFYFSSVFFLNDLLFLIHSFCLLVSWGHLHLHKIENGIGLFVIFYSMWQIPWNKNVKYGWIGAKKQVGTMQKWIWMLCIMCVFLRACLPIFHVFHKSIGHQELSIYSSIHSFVWFEKHI